jgi:hypothetical protein
MAAGAGDDDAGAARSTVRACGARDDVVVSGGGRTAAVCGLAGVDTAGWSAWRVTVPLRLKFWSSLGPIVPGVVELVVGGGAGVAVWANAGAGARDTAHATNIKVSRKIALIRSRS